MRSFAIGVLSLFLLSSPAAAEQITFEPSEASLNGKLLKNFVMLSSGEMLTGYVLHLEAPVTIQGNEESTERRNRRSVRNINQVLVEFESEAPSDDILGGEFLIHGRLYNEPSDPHHTKIRMRASEYEILSEPEDQRSVGTYKTH